MIAGVIDSLARGDLASRATIAGRDEVGSLAADVNELGRRLYDAEEQRSGLDRERRELTTAISHDLRTPLASLRAMVEALDDRVVEGEEVQRYYATMRRELDRLSRMIDGLFELSRIDAGAPLSRSRVPVEEIVAEAVDALQPQARLNHVNLGFNAPMITVALLDGDRIERAVTNLVRNAIEHTPPGGRIDVDVSESGGWVDVSVSDTGTGVNSADLPHIWERFYRAERSRPRSTSNGDGAGLGLAIVRGIVEAHGGSVSARSEPGSGSTFVMRLPCGDVGTTNKP
jgi:signal transduction histidine kinase